MVDYAIIPDCSDIPQDSRFKNTRQLAVENARNYLSRLELHRVLPNAIKAMTARVMPDSNGQVDWIAIEPAAGARIHNLTFIQKKLHQEEFGDEPHGIKFFRQNDDEIGFTLRFGPRAISYTLRAYATLEAQEPAEVFRSYTPRPAPENIESAIRSVTPKKMQGFAIKGRMCKNKSLEMIAAPGAEAEYTSVERAIREMPVDVRSDDGSPAIVAYDGRMIIIMPKKGSKLSISGYEEALAQRSIVAKARSTRTKRNFQVRDPNGKREDEFLIFAEHSKILEHIENTGIEGRLVYRS